MTPSSPAIARAVHRLRALSLWNPHAGLMALGAKAVESRGRKLGVQPGPLAIASTVAVSREYRDDLDRQIRDDPRFAKWCKPNGWTSLDTMPRGSILALVWVTGEYSVSHMIRDAIGKTYGADELAFGYYDTPGRVAIMTDADRRIRLQEPVAIKGAQGVWAVEPDAVAAIRAQVEGSPLFRYYRDYLNPAT